MAGRGGNGNPAEQEFPGWRFAVAQEDPHPPVRHVHAARGLPAQARHKNEEGPADFFIPDISKSMPSHHHQFPGAQWSKNPTTPRPHVPAPVEFIIDAFQHQKDELKEKARQKLLRLSGGGN